jgi:hypothetical protein
MMNMVVTKEEAIAELISSVGNVVKVAKGALMAHDLDPEPVAVAIMVAHLHGVYHEGAVDFDRYIQFRDAVVGR